MFGHLSQIVFVEMSYPQKDFIKAECDNLVRYLENIKQEYWPDWNTLCDSGTFY